MPVDTDPSGRTTVMTFIASSYETFPFSDASYLPATPPIVRTGKAFWLWSLGIPLSEPHRCPQICMLDGICPFLVFGFTAIVPVYLQSVANFF